MEKSDAHTCKICNKQYSSNSSLWNHTSKFHKSVKDYHDNPSDNPNNPLIILHDKNNKNEIVAVKTYDCKLCKKSFKYFQNRWRHEKICTKKNEIIVKENTTNIQNINNTTNNINNGTINNNTIIINNFNEDNVKYISNDFMKRVLDRLACYDDESLKGGIPHLVENIKFNKGHKENNNVQITNVKSKVAKKYIENKWQHVKKDQMLREMHNTALKVLQKWVDENKDTITKKMMDGLKDYTNISPSYKKKVIHEEINLLGYNYYKNNMENQLDK